VEYLSLYIEFLEEHVEQDATSPTGTVRRIVPSGRCAVFDEEELNKLINDVRHRLRTLVALKDQATKHHWLIAEDALRKLGVPFKTRKFVKKRC
jgi:hypothetical protein